MILVVMDIFPVEEIDLKAVVANLEKPKERKGLFLGSFLKDNEGERPVYLTSKYSTVNVPANEADEPVLSQRKVDRWQRFYSKFL